MNEKQSDPKASTDPRKRAEQAVLDSEKKLENLMDNLPIGIGISTPGPKGVVTEVNSALLKIFGYDSKEEFLKVPASDHYVDPEERRQFSELRKEGPVKNYETRFRRKDGTVFWGSASAIPQKTESGEVEFLNIFEDITERERVDDEMRRQSELLQAIFDNIPVMITMYDVQGRMKLLNREFERLIGWSPEEAAKVDLMEQVYPAPEYRKKAWEYMLSASTGWRDFMVTTKTGEIVESSWSNVRLPDGSQIGIGIDITARKKQEGILRRRHDELATQNRIIHAIFQTLDLDEVLNRILDEVMALLNVELGGIHLMEESGVVLRTWRGLSDEFCSQVRFFPREQAPDWMQTPCLVHERLSEQGLMPDFAKQEGMQAWAALPLKMRQDSGEESVTGTLVLGSKHYQAIGEDNLNALKAVSEQLGLAIIHARLYRSSRERLVRLQVLREIDQAIIGRHSIDEILQIALKNIPEEMGAEAVAVSLLDGDPQRPRIFLMRLPNGTVIEEQAFELAESLLSWLIERKEPVIIYDLAQDPRVQMHFEQIRDHRLASYLGVPMVSQDKTIGIMQILTARPKVFLEEDVAFFTTLAGQVAIAVENVSLLEEIKTAEEKYRQLAENAPNIIYKLRLAPERGFEYVSPAVTAITGYSPEAYYTDPDLILKMVAPDDRALAEAIMEGTRPFDKPLTIRMRRKDGGLLWMEHDITPIFDASGNLVAIEGIGRDITERQRAQEELRLDNEIMTNMADGVYLVRTSDGLIVHTNHQFEEMFGYNSGELIGKHVSIVNAPTDKSPEETAKEIMGVLNRSGVWYGEVQNIKKDGTPFWCYASVSTFEHPAFGMVWISIHQDITERKKAQGLREAAEAAEAASHAKSAFLSNMSHEIRTPMNAILGFAQLLHRDPLLTPRQRKDVATINRAGEHLLSLIDDILDISKIEAGRISLNPTVFCLHDLIEDLELMFRSRTGSKGLQLLMERDKSVPRHVIGDEGKLRQVFTNLLGNAVKFTEQGGIAMRVSAEAVAEGPGDVRLIVEIEDSGPGIPKDDLQRIFGIFAQAGDGAASGGTGLGLAISRNLMQMMGGDITVSSEVGKGSCFRFDVVVQPADADAIEEKARPRLVTGLAPGAGPVRTLVVDNNTDNRTLLAALLKPVGFEVEEAADGREALEVFERFSPHVVFMDMRMPVMDGYEATRRIRGTEAGRTTPIIAVTASAFDAAEEKVKEAGADAYIRKPFREDEIFSALERLLDLHFVYDDQKNVPPEEHAAPTLEAVAGLPNELMRAMRQTIEEGDMGRLTELIERVEEIDPAAACMLQALADRYDYERLGEVLGKGDA